eukprot:TRINITY_DN150_c0_g1_i1.p2 TRINITY_DN150_c0_g1~~TRINITY_DN150_c0_g1_i1.p2  ORF type:complete len:308 (+),score=44.57 TRINITY_DN150_c0_g1_i1:1974-2897(+)
MGGDVNVKSKMGFGTNMIVVFPSQTCPEVPLLENVENFGVLKEHLVGKRCLILDDIQENTYILQNLLQAHGLSVAPYNKAENALKDLERVRNIDLIITDLRMPDMSGQQFILKLRENEERHRLGRIPVLVLTGEAAPGEKIACLSQYGVDEFLLKPVKLHYLLSTIEKLLAGRADKRIKNVLLIDDDAMSQKLISNIIKQVGNQPFVCGSVMEAKQEFEKDQEKYDVIFLDSQLPDGSGLDFMAFYQQLLENAIKRPPVISMSGNSILDQHKMYENYQMHAFLEKPISKATLLNIIDSIQQLVYVII